MSTGTSLISPPAGGWIWRPLVGASLSQVVLGIVRPTMSYAGLNLGADGFMIGVIAASFALAPVFVALSIGSLSGRLRHIGLVPFGSALLLASGCALAAVASSVTVLILASLLLGVGNLGVLIGAQAWISRSAPSAKYHDGFGWMTAGMALGQSVGPLIAGLVVGPMDPDAGGIMLAFWISATVALLLSVVFVSRAARTYGELGSSETLGAGAILRMPGVTRYIFVSAAVLTSVDILTAYLPVLGADAGIAPVLIGAMLAVRGAASTLSRLLLGSLSRRFSQPGLIGASLVGTALCLVTVSFVPVPWVMFVALAVGGFFLGLGQPLTMTAVALALPAPARSSGLALRLLGNRVAQTATPLLAGAVTAVFGVASVFLVQVGGLAVSAVWEALATRRRNESR